MCYNRFMSKTVILFLIAAYISLHGLSLKDKLKEAEEGDFIVSSQNSTINVLIISKVDLPYLVFEEISYPLSFTLQKGETWASWIEKGAKGHNSWTVFEIDLNDSQITECFSYTRNAWLLLSQEDSFLLKLLDLPLEFIRENDRKKIGPTPFEGPDLRKVWNPPLVINGEKKVSPRFDAYRTTWPKDKTPLSNKRIELYFNKQEKRFPFPYWAQITDDSEAAFKMRVIDSGAKLAKTGKQLLRRPLRLIKPIIWNQEGVKIFIESPSYYKNLHLFAIDSSSSEKTSIPLIFEESALEGGKILHIPSKEADRKLVNEHSYSFIISAEKPLSISIESKPISKENVIGINQSSL